MIADRFHYRTHSRITDAEAFACHAANVDFTAGGSVEGDVTDDDVFGGDEGRLGRGIEDQFAAAQAFAEVVVGIACEFEGDSGGDECAEALSGTALEFDTNGIFGESVPMVFSDFVTEDGADGAVDIADGEGGGGGFARLDLFFLSSLRMFSQVA
jgi:hypothetical protein